MSKSKPNRCYDHIASPSLYSLQASVKSLRRQTLSLRRQSEAPAWPCCVLPTSTRTYKSSHTPTRRAVGVAVVSAMLMSHAHAHMTRTRACARTHLHLSLTPSPSPLTSSPCRSNATRAHCTSRSLPPCVQSLYPPYSRALYRVRVSERDVQHTPYWFGWRLYHAYAQCCAHMLSAALD